MTTGQRAFWVTADVAVLTALETRLEVQETARSAAHGAQLRTVLELAALFTGRGMGISTVSHTALSLGCSEQRAHDLLTQGRGLAELPGALEAVECGLLTVEHCPIVVRQLAVLPLAARVGVWRRLQQRLIADADSGSVLPPARLNELLRRWVIAADPADADARRQRAEAGRTLDYRLRPDGLGDLFALGFRAPDLHAILSRIHARSAPWGAGDDRTADQRRFDAFRDLLLGRDHPTTGCAHDTDQTGDQTGGAAGCGCLPGQPVPCGAELAVTVPLGGALGSTDEVAELAGHGPIEPDLLTELLLAAPRLRPVWVSPDGTPVAVGDQVIVPRRDDPGSVRQALLQLAALPPPAPQPRHPHDHTPPPEDTNGGGAAHPPDTPGPYRPPRWLRRLINARAPRCEWPGCGARAVRCDSEHDDAWPDGPTCACNLGPCCRRHHQIKQHGWTKTRTAAGVRWTSLTGRSRLSPTQHEAPVATVRPPPPVATPSPWDQLSPSQLDDELSDLDLLPVDDWTSHQPPVDHEPAADHDDGLRERLLHTDTRWTLDLADPYRWLDPAPADLG